MEQGLKKQPPKKSDHQHRYYISQCQEHDWSRDEDGILVTYTLTCEYCGKVWEDTGRWDDRRLEMIKQSLINKQKVYLARGTDVLLKRSKSLYR
jgi:hypothetical protein